MPDGQPDGYVVPPSNPFVDSVPVAALTEIWAFGLRNPWRFTFDDATRGGTGALVIGDVGQDTWEEIDYEPAGRGGRNYGWRNREGRRTTDVPTRPARLHAADRSDLRVPTTAAAASITGGYVYRGTALGPASRPLLLRRLRPGRVWSLALTVNPTTTRRPPRPARAHRRARRRRDRRVSSFGVDADGELFAVDYGGTIFRILPQDPPNLRCPR